MERTQSENEKTRKLDTLLRKVSMELSVPHRFVKVFETGEIAAIFPTQPTQADVFRGEVNSPPKYDDINECVQIVESALPETVPEELQTGGETEQTERMGEDVCGHSSNAPKNVGHLNQQAVVLIERLDLAAVSKSATPSSEEIPKHRKFAVASTYKKFHHQLPRRSNLAGAEFGSRDPDAGNRFRKRSLSAECSSDLKESRYQSLLYKQPRQEDAEANTSQQVKSWYFKPLELEESVPGTSQSRVSGSSSSCAWTSQQPEHLPVIVTDINTASVGSDAAPDSGKVEDVCEEMDTLNIHGYVDDVD